jgi:hypothetical protein
MIRNRGTMGTWLENYLEQNPDTARRPLVKQTAHSSHFQIAPGLARAVITGNAQSYRDVVGWKGVDSTLRQDGSGNFGAPGVAARVSVDGVVRIASYAYQQQTVSVGTLADGEYSKSLDLPRGYVARGQLVREQGNYRHEVVLTQPGIKEQLVVLQKPSGLDGEFFVFETILPAGFIKEGWLVDEFATENGMRISPGRAFDAAGHIYPMECFAIDQGLHQHLYSGLPLSILEQAVYPLTLDPIVSIGVDTNDADVWGQNATYATARSTSANVATSNTILFCGQHFDSAIPRYTVQRNFLKFSLASIDADAALFSATLGLVCVADDSTLTDFDVQIVKQSWAAQDPLSSGNREAAFDASLAGTLDTVWRNTNGITTGVMHHSPPLDLSYLIPGANAYYSLRSSRDKNGNAPPANGAEWLQLASGNHANPAYRPILTIDYANVLSAAGRFGVPAVNAEIRDTRIKLRARQREKLLTTTKSAGEG